MKESSGTSRHVLWGVLLGFIAAGVVATFNLFGFGVLQRVEWHSLDFRLKHAAPAPEMTDIVHVDIDDTSLERVGRWPWPRQRIAGIIDALRDAGADVVALDILFTEPQELRYYNAADEIYSVDDSAVLQDAPPQPIFDDALLREAIRQTPVLFIPVYIEAEQEKLNPVGPERAVPWADPGRPLAEALKKHAAASLWARQRMADVYLRQRAKMAVERFALPLNELSPQLGARHNITPPLVTLLQVADGSGYVTFQADADGTVRQMPLLTRAHLGGGKEFPFPQFAFAVAMDFLQRKEGRTLSLRATPHAVEILSGEEILRDIPLVGPVGQGRMIIAWEPRSWSDDPKKMADGLHLPAHSALNSWTLKQRLKDIAARRFFQTQRFLGLGQSLPAEPKEIKTLFWKATQLNRTLSEVYQKRIAAERTAQRALLYDPQAGPAAEKALAELKTTEDTTEKQLHETCFKLVALLRQPTHLDVFLASKPEAKAQAETILKEFDRLAGLAEESQRQLEKTQSDLRKKVAGKICLIGSTATGAADFVPTVLSKRTPGMLVHSNIINTILQNHFIDIAPTWLNSMVILLSGLLVSILTSRGSLIHGAWVTLLLLGVFAAVNIGVVFYLWNTWLALVAPILAMLAAFLTVSVYRQITEERAKRRIKGMFSHALSSELVEMVLDDPALVAPRNQPITCLFSDLAGFTSLSGQLGPARTVELLHRYFDQVSDVLQTQHGGYVNKFLGDGVFAFFGAPVVQADHAARAIQASIDYQKRVDQLNRELTAEFELPEGIHVRLGVNTDEGMVGDCGSSQRMDYTAIGEVVNLAARLEAANKCFGTRILVSSSAWQAAGLEGIVARPMGRAIISGISQPVILLHILGREKEIEPGQIRAAESQKTGYDALEARDFAAATSAFRTVLESIPDDFAATWWLQRCEEALTDPTVSDKPTPSIVKSGIVRLLWPWEAAEGDEFQTPK